MDFSLECYPDLNHVSVRREHQPAAAGADAHELDTWRVARREVHRDAGRNFRVAVVEHHPAGINLADEAGHVVHLSHVPEEGVAHVAPCGERDLLILDVQDSVGEQVAVADVVVVEVRYDQGPHRLRIDAERAQAVGGCRSAPTDAPFPKRLKWLIYNVESRGGWGHYRRRL